MTLGLGEDNGNCYGYWCSSTVHQDGSSFNLDHLKLIKPANKIITDSGSIQKEAYILKVPCITLGENTEWVETVEDDWNVLVEANNEKIVKMVNGFNPLLKTHKERFGSGDASRKVVFRISER